jgi:hypothetical protein
MHDSCAAISARDDDNNSNIYEYGTKCMEINE